ncbi:hypothetical protein COO60DRAFT_1541836, partial [Scenedesmus sp. NREL 46B-D3]
MCCVGLFGNVACAAVPLWPVWQRQSSKLCVDAAGAAALCVEAGGALSNSACTEAGSRTQLKAPQRCLCMFGGPVQGVCVHGVKVMCVNVLEVHGVMLCPHLLHNVRSLACPSSCVVFGPLGLATCTAPIVPIIEYVFQAPACFGVTSAPSLKRWVQFGSTACVAHACPQYWFL